MKVKELIDILKQYPEDMEVMDYNEVTGTYPMKKPEIALLQNIQHHEWNNKPREWQSWSYPTSYPLYKAEFIKEETCLVFGF